MFRRSWLPLSDSALWILGVQRNCCLGFRPYYSGLILFFLVGLLVGLFAQWLVRGSHGAWRTFLLVMIVIAAPFAILFSWVGGPLGLLFVVLGPLVPYLLLVGIPMLIRKSWKRFQRPHRQGE